jgi:conjugative transfer signal peptidase TraF
MPSGSESETSSAAGGGGAPSFCHLFSNAMEPKHHLALFGSLLLVAATAAPAAARLTVNVTPSLPRGLYLISPGEPVHRGDLAVFPVPRSVASTIRERQYLPAFVRTLLKPVAAAPGDQLCIDDSGVIVNGARVAPLIEVDSAGRPIRVFRFCGTVPEGQAFVAVPAARSLDSRCFGLVPIGTLTVARPLWTF